MMTPQVSLLLAVALFVVVVSGTSVDQTTQPGASGSGVVEAVCSRLEVSCAFQDDKLFLRRLAYVESFDGADPKTFRAGYFGGIWQVSNNFSTLIRVLININTTI